MTQTFRILTERVASLDAPLTAADRYRMIDPDLNRFIRVTSSATSAGPTGGRLAPVSSVVADETLSRSKLLGRLRRRAPEVSNPPLQRTQYWINAGKPPHLPRPPKRLERAHFVEAHTHDDLPPSTKPFYLGLYTCTATLATYGMWWCYLQLNEGSTLFPRPHRIWSLEAAVSARVLEIETASEWVDFVRANPLQHEGLVYPSWRNAARRWDAIHMTVGAVAATQGISFTTDGAVTAPCYWDVETTLWLHWVFPTVQWVAEEA